MQPDRVEGAWLQFASTEGEQLVRIHEDGRAALVGLPPKLRDSDLEIRPLRGGWLVAANHHFPGGLREQQLCENGFNPCGSLAVAQLSPRGRWTSVQTFPGAFLPNEETREVLAESHGRIELAWLQEGAERIRLVVARRGIFHFAWIDSRAQVETTAVHVKCAGMGHGSPGGS
jgi:hypothetical protein